MKAFRWNLTKHEQLSTLLDGNRATAYAGFFDELQKWAAKLVVAAKPYDFVFVGRSPESIYDFLTGVFAASSYAGKLIHLNILNRFERVNQIKGESAFNFEGLIAHSKELGLTPSDIVRHDFLGGVIDLVYSGGTSLFMKIYRGAIGKE